MNRLLILLILLACPLLATGEEPAPVPADSVEPIEDNEDFSDDYEFLYEPGDLLV